MMDAVAELLLRLAPRAGLGRFITIEKPGAGLDHHAIAARKIRREPELAPQQHGPAGCVVGQNTDAMAVVMHLADGVERAAVMLFDIDPVACKPGPARIDEFGRSNHDLGDEIQTALRSLR